ncbi:hypothetical protein AMATHDRAFT_47880 [Amanita thiersii Skay4041]|uniref:SET domain-containing protein n=1 Tax=Amanita thiersii Skay4041 TaxID=703135 RepID=A0A2A9NS19_9AGAR|nr:hypothetical protein AMATHDRAFT_47880 [Amanita thiersii Skay4041]
MEHKIATLNAWCTLNGIEIDNRIKVYWNPDTGIGVRSKHLYTPPHTTLVRIPKDAVLSTRNCTLSEFIPSSPCGLAAQLALALALYIEILKGKISRWFGYLQSFYGNVVDIPLFWDREIGVGESSHARLEDGKCALEWLQGTEAHKILNKLTDNNITLIVVQPLIHRHRENISKRNAVEPTLHGFYRAYSLVSSRAFLVDAYHGLSMVPIADAFNHELQNHVHLEESDYHVCSECGSLHECPHDRDDAMSIAAVDHITSMARSVVPFVVDNDDQDHGYHMVTNTAIPPDAEVYNTYGETLTNAQLLTQYGFILEVNDNDVLAWEMGDIIGCASSDCLRVSRVNNGLMQRYWSELCQLDWTIMAETSLIYTDNSERTKGGGFTVNGDGKVSHHLWLAMAVLSLSQGFERVCEDIETIVNRLRNLVNTQIMLESHLEVEDEEVEISLVDDDTIDPELVQELIQICQLIIHLCADRHSKTGKKGLNKTVSELGQLFDVGYSFYT